MSESEIWDVEAGIIGAVQCRGRSQGVVSRREHQGQIGRLASGKNGGSTVVLGYV